MSVLVVGDANVDLEIRLPAADAPKLHANPAPRLLGGGSAANTAAGLARLGIESRFVGTVGDDSFGRFAVDSLMADGVDTTSVATAPDSPTVTVITVTQPNGERLIYTWPPSGGAHGALEAETAVEAITGAQWLHVSGICLRTVPSRQAVLAVMEQAQTDGVGVSFDLNLRLEYWGWTEDFREAVDAAVEHSDVILGAASDEIQALAGSDDPVEAATSLARGGRLVIARLGEDGALACSEEGVASAPGFPVAVVDTVGAGDAFNAGFIAARLRQSDVATSLRWGNAAAALTISKPGARSGPTLAELEQLLAV
ncbi:MAG: carbohydrate kinase family protein [Acidimicrobiia bacterium]